MVKTKKIKRNSLNELEALRRRVAELEKQLHQQSREEEMFHILRINSPIGLFIIRDGKFQFVNDVFRRITGRGPEELIGTDSLALVAPEDREMVRRSAIQTLKGKTSSPYQYRIIHKNGEVRWMLEGVTSIQYEGKRAVLGHSLDITEQELAEEKLEELYQQERKLRQELEAEVQRRIEFTRALVHELKTPLTPVLSSSDLLLSEVREEPLLSIARNIHRGAANLNNRIDELLDLARVEIGMLQVNLREVVPLPLLRSIAEETRALIASNKQTLIVDLPSSLSHVWADEERLRQIVLNLLINATKFTPEGGTITLRAGEEDLSLVVEVIDTGRGISENEQERLFQAYHRQLSDLEHLSGLGLGLALSKNLVELQGGKIWLKSQPGKGSTFSFSIPLAEINQLRETVAEDYLEEYDESPDN